MANFNVHIKTAACISTFLSLGIYTSGIVDEQQSVMLALTGTLGGILPDIDSDYSTSIDIVFQIFGGFIALLVLFSIVQSIGLLLTMLFGVVAYITITMPFRKIFEKFTVHRGLYHSIPMGLFLSLLTVLLCTLLYGQSLLFCWGVGLFLFIGFLIHLLLDEIYSVDLAGIRLKRSFGTALKFYDADQWSLYLLLYGFIIVLLFYLKDYLPESFNDSQNFTLLWHHFLNNLWPDAHYLTCLRR